MQLPTTRKSLNSNPFPQSLFPFVDSSNECVFSANYMLYCGHRWTKRSPHLREKHSLGDERHFSENLQSRSGTPAAIKCSTNCCGLHDKISKSYRFNFFRTSKFDTYFVSNLFWEFLETPRIVTITYLAKFHKGGWSIQPCYSLYMHRYNGAARSGWHNALLKA